ncbi:MAG: hypothetical protein IKY62_02460 [Clostridia bacterium]|nr:hypothetical protein [Clostridia bacterium]
MNDRERLVELLNKPLLRFRHEAWENSDKIADYLIANGVTFERRGRWIVERDDLFLEGEHYRMVCSECGRIVFNIQNPHKAIKYRPYCHCGAKMDGEA